MDERYTATAIALHWLLAALIATSFGVGLWMSGLPISPTRLRVVNWHKWAGATILGLTTLRLAWRLTHPPPPDLPAPSWQLRAAHATHALIYALCFAVPLVGWAYSSAAGFPLVVYGVLPLPDFVPKDRALAEAIKPWHGALAWTLASLVAVHVAAAAKHRFVDRDRVLARMLPARSLR
jgi:cytochrome b561